MGASVSAKICISPQLKHCVSERERGHARIISISVALCYLFFLSHALALMEVS